jgi:hypothetical protein
MYNDFILDIFNQCSEQPDPDQLRIVLALDRDPPLVNKCQMRIWKGIF